MPARSTLDIRWLTSDPDALASRLGGYGFAVAGDRRVGFATAGIRIEAGSGRDDRLEIGDSLTSLAAPVAAPARSHPNGIEDVIAVGWATVDRERFTAGDATRSVEILVNDPHLGAFVLRTGTRRPYALVLEPDTEGRLAASLARFGEGPTAIYVRTGAGGLAAFVADAQRRRSPVSSVQTGPLGPSVILHGGPAWGPHILVVEADPES